MVQYPEVPTLMTLWEKKNLLLMLLCCSVELIDIIVRVLDYPRMMASFLMYWKVDLRCVGK